LKKAYDIIARIPGSVYPEEWIVRGNHRDAWVNGAADPLTGLNALMEEARAFSELLKQGWKPKRTIIYCAWDAEEPAMLGSTEWAEAHADELRQHAAVYINTDSNGRGYFSAGGSHTLEKFINEVAREIQDPEKKITVWKRSQLARIASSKGSREEVRRRADLRIGALGSGSDFAAFVHHLGIASLSLGYGGEDGSGVGHSIYDTFYWYTHFSDTDFVYGRTLAETVGITVMRLANAELLPYDFINLADTIHKYVSELQRLLKDQQEQIQERNRQIEEGVFSATADPKKTFVPPAVEPVPPYLNFAPLENAADVLTRSAERYDKALAKAAAGGGTALARLPLQSVNAKLIETERRLTDPAGLPGRPWFKHQIYAPGLYTGYGVKTIPAVREAMEQKKWKEAEAGIVRVAKILEGEAALIESAAAEIEKAVR
jgi:N-acetylated-alpha-linked acidic dipeptidase